MCFCYFKKGKLRRQDFDSDIMAAFRFLSQLKYYFPLIIFLLFYSHSTHIGTYADNFYMCISIMILIDKCFFCLTIQ